MRFMQQGSFVLIAITMENQVPRNGRKQASHASILWWIALIVCLSCLLGLHTLLDP